MNRLSSKERAAIIRALVEGNSLRSTTRITGHSINTVSKLLVELGAASTVYLDTVLRDLPATRIECDEIWAFCYAKQSRVPADHEGEWGFGDVWTWVALDPDSKLVCSWLVGLRDAADAKLFIKDLSTRLANRVQLTTDGHRPYVDAVEEAFGIDVDFAQLIKEYGADPSEERRFSPPVVLSERVHVIRGNPDPDKISTSYVERQNLTMRMGMRRFTRLTNGFSKKVENHAASIALHFMYMNFARPHKTLANPYPRTPAMAAGLADHIWTCEEIAALLD
ncbi:MAG TPA: IS1 family transposase [Candidatus Limnocylindrales bacterium]|nr:IS1 family transposase [Candidatus Limnocylindrales bacterium]